MEDKQRQPIEGGSGESEVLNVKCPKCGDIQFYRFKKSNNQDWMCINPDCDFTLHSMEYEVDINKQTIARAINKLQCSHCGQPLDSCRECNTHFTENAELLCVYHPCKGTCFDYKHYCVECVKSMNDKKKIRDVIRLLISTMDESFSASTIAEVLDMDYQTVCRILDEMAMLKEIEPNNTEWRKV